MRTFRLHKPSLSVYWCSDVCSLHVCSQPKCLSQPTFRCFAAVSQQGSTQAWISHPCTTISCAAHPPPFALQELDLGDGDSDIVTVDDLSMSQLAGLAPTLRRLSLARCRWVSSCEPLKALVHLQELDLSHTDVGSRALEALADLPALTGLNLTGCRCVVWVGGARGHA